MRRRAAGLPHAGLPRRLRLQRGLWGHLCPAAMFKSSLAGLARQLPQPGPASPA